MSGMFRLNQAVVGCLLITDFDLEVTVDVTPSYTDIVYVFQAGDSAADCVAQSWLDSKVGS